MLFKLRIAAAVFITALPVFAQGVPPRNAQVMRATLDNGLRVVIVRDPLAPVVTVEAELSCGRGRNACGIPRNGARSGTHGVPRMLRPDSGPDCRDLCATGRRR